MPKNGEVNISGEVRAGGRIFTRDSVTHNGKQVGEDKGIDLANAPEELRIGMKLGSSITKGEITYVFVKRDSQTGEYIYKKSTKKTPVEKKNSTTRASEPEVGSEEWLQQLNATIEEAEAKKKATLPTFDSLKAMLPRGAITDPEIVGRFKQINGKLYRMLKPTTQTQEGYVYIPIAE